MTNIFNIEDVVVEDATVTLAFPEVPEATITVARVSSDALIDIRTKSTVGKHLNTETKTFEDKIDNEKFLKFYSDVVIKDWTGLKAKHLKRLMLCSIPADKLEEEVECTSVNKNTLMSKSKAVDDFITSTLQSVSIFNQEIEESESKKSSNG